MCVRNENKKIPTIYNELFRWWYLMQVVVICDDAIIFSHVGHSILFHVLIICFRLHFQPSTDTTIELFIRSSRFRCSQLYRYMLFLTPTVPFLCPGQGTRHWWSSTVHINNTEQLRYLEIIYTSNNISKNEMKLHYNVLMKSRSTNVSFKNLLSQIQTRQVCCCMPPLHYWPVCNSGEGAKLLTSCNSVTPPLTFPTCTRQNKQIRRRPKLSNTSFNMLNGHANILQSFFNRKRT